MPNNNQQKVKILVGGAPNAGKTRFIQTAVHGEKWLTDDEWQGRKQQVCQDAIRMDAHLGEITISDDLTIHLVNLPPQSDPLHLQKWELASQGSLGHILIVDSTQPEKFANAIYVLETLQQYATLPYVVVANKQDAFGAVDLGQIREGLKLDASVWLLPCVAIKKDSVTAVLTAALMAIADTPHS